MKTKIYKSIQALRAAATSSRSNADLRDASTDDKVRFVLDQLEAVRYSTLSREDKGLVRESLQKVTGYSRSQIARYIQLHRSQIRQDDEPESHRSVTWRKTLIGGAAVCAILFALSWQRSSAPSNVTGSVTGGALVFQEQESTDELVLNDADQETFEIRRALKPDRSLTRTRAVVSLRNDGNGVIAAEPLFIAQDTVEQTGDRTAVRNRILATDVEELRERVEQRRRSRQRYWNNKEAHEGAVDASMRPAAPVSSELTSESTLDEIREYMRSKPAAQPGQVLTLENGVPVWRDIHSMIRPGVGRIPKELHGGHGAAGGRGTITTRRGGGGSGGGGGGGSTTVTQIIQQSGGGDSEWDSSTGLVFLATSSDFVGIGTSTPETKLEVVGTISGSALAASNLSGCTSLATDANGNITCGSGAGGSGKSVFVGTTTVTTYDGQFTSGGDTGYEAANALCAAEFSGSHFCQVDEVIGTIATEDIDTLFSGVPDAWVAEGAPGFTADSNDCRGWTSNTSTHLGAWWDFDTDGGGIGYLTNCSTTKPIACCR